MRASLNAMQLAPVGSIQWWRYAYRLPLLIVHLTLGTVLALICFMPGLRRIPAGGTSVAGQAHRAWSRLVLGIFGIRLRVCGRLPRRPLLLVANHITWLDIAVLHAVWPVRLVAKAEIRRWPLVGWLAAVAGTVFIARGSESSRQRVGRRMAAVLRWGGQVGIFPEGGIHPAHGVGRFHARLFGAAVRARTPVVPVAIRYDRGGDLHVERVLRPGENFVVNVLKMLGLPPCQVHVMIGPELWPDGGSRSQLARRAERIVVDFYDQPAVD